MVVIVVVTALAVIFVVGVGIAVANTIHFEKKHRDVPWHRNVGGSEGPAGIH